MAQPDPDHWQSWLARHKAGLFLLARQHLPTRQEAEDAVQEGFVKFWKSRKGARDAAAYLFACVRSAAIDLRRAGDARRRRERASGEAVAGAMFISPLERDESRVQIERALVEWPAEQREVLVMKIWSGLTFGQIGVALGISPNTAASRYRYAIGQLQLLLGAKVLP